MLFPPTRRRRFRSRALAAVIGTVILALVGGPAAVNAVAEPIEVSAADEWSTSFENGANPPDDGQGWLVGTVDNGPDQAYAAKTDVGFTGLHALHYSGRHEPEGPARETSFVADVDVPIGSDTELSYVLFPQFDEEAVDYAGTYVAVDLLFTDGTRLSDLDARDQNGDAVTARAQGDAKTLSPRQWNRRTADIGLVAEGKTVDKVLLTYDGPSGPSDIGGWIDDVAIGTSDPPKRSRPSDWVDTTRGTQSTGDYSRGNNFPATAVPNGFNFWTPMTDAGSLGTLYSYHRQNNDQNRPEIQAFSASHQTSIWMGDRQTFQVMPSVADGVPNPGREARALPFRHENESASPHHYDVTFDNGLRAEIAPTDHAAMMRFTFPDQGGRNLIFDNVDENADFTIDPEAGTVSGWSETRTTAAGMTRMYMYGEFDATLTDSGKLTEGHRPSTGYVSFGANEESVSLRMATSLIGVDQAQRNLEQEIGVEDTLEEVAGRAQDAWDERLGVVEVEDATDDELTTLYSNLYRINLYPNSGYENTGTTENPRYQHAVQSSDSTGAPPSSPTETGAEIADGKVYVNTGFWDTYRTAWPAYSLLYPDFAGELVDGFVQQYRDGGWVSPWSSPGYARVMTGTNSDSAFADAFAKDIPGIDAEDTYDAALKNATVRPPNDNVGRNDLDRSIFLGFVPNDVDAGFSWSLDGYVNDSSIAAMAEAMVNRSDISEAERKRLSEEAEYLRSRAEGYSEVFDPSVDFFQGKSADGQWTTPTDEYDPRTWGNEHDYTEANGWNEAFTAPHDGQGLAELYGGRDGLAGKLDEYFSTPETADRPGSYDNVIHEMRETRDLRLGQWSIPNQVSHHIPWMYNYTQQPWKGQEVIRQALDRGWLGSDIGQGYPGDEDNGATSAWWVFSALGLYPLQPASGEYAIGSPLFERATLHLSGGDLTIDAPGTSDGDIYVQDLAVDGEQRSATTVSHDEIADGGSIEFAMGEEPSDWGTGEDDVPDSPTPQGERPQAMHDVTSPGDSASTPADDPGALSDNTSRTSASLSGTDPEIRYDLGDSDPGPVGFYTLTSGAGGADQDPVGWVLEGSQDGQQWSELDRRSGEEFRWRNQTRPFRIEQPQTMSQYRLRLLSADGQQTISLAEVELLGDSRAASPE